MKRKFVLAVAACAGLLIPAILWPIDVVKDTTGDFSPEKEIRSLVPDTLPNPAAVKIPTPVTSPGIAASDSISEARRRTPRPELKSRIQPTPPATSIHIGRTHTAFTPEQLVKGVFLYSDGGTPCEIDGLISDVSFTGTGWNGTAWIAARGLSYFENGLVEFQDVVDGEAVEMADGLLLATGNGLNMEGHNASGGAMADGTAYLTGDPDLTPLITPQQVMTGAILEFNFIPQQDHISFEYSFASEEYPEYVNMIYNDVFGFFIHEINPVTHAMIGPKTNIARLPITHTNDYDVKINNVNWGYRNTNDANTFTGAGAIVEGTQAEYIANTNRNPKAFNPLYHKQIPQVAGTSMEFDGRTVILTAGYDVIPGHMYHLKLAVADVFDNLYGSGVFLKAGSLKIGTGVTNWGNRISGMDQVYESCADNFLTIFAALDGATRNVTLEYEHTGCAPGSIVQLDGSPMPTHRVVPANQNIDTIYYKVADGVTEGTIRVRAYVPGCAGDPLETTIYVHPKFINPQLVVTPDCGGANLGTISVSVTGGHAPQMSRDNGATWQSVHVPFTGLAEGTNYSIRVRDSIGCIYDTVMYATIPPCYKVVPENATVQEYQEIVIDVLANDVLPATIFTPTFNLMNAVIPGNLPKAGTLSAGGVGANSRFVYRNDGASSNNIDSFKYQFNVTYPVPQTLSATVYIYILQDQNGATACMNTPYTINLAAKPVNVQFYWTPMGGVESTTPSPTRLIANVTDTVSFLVRPVVPNAATLYKGPFPAGKFTAWVGDKPGMGEMRWVGHFNNDWKNPGNWVQRKGSIETPVLWAPSTCVDVVVSANVDNSPELTSAVSCRNILLKNRAMLKNPHVLTYDNASVEIKLKPAELDRFVMWSAPLKDMYSGDYHYRVNGVDKSQGDVFMNLFQQANPDYTTGGAAEKDFFTATEGNVNQPLGLGRAFNLKVAHTSVTIDSFLRFPSPVDNYNGVALSPRSNKNKFITHGASLGAGNRYNLDVYGGGAGYRLVQVVNPYMAYLKIEDFLAANTNFQSGYYIWNGELTNGFHAVSLTSGKNRITYNSVTMDNTISNVLVAPLQSFFIAKKDAVLNTNITTVAMSPDWTTTSPSASSYSLRSAVANGGVLHIKVSQGNKEAYAAMVFDPDESNFIGPNDLPAIVYDELPLTLYTYSNSNIPLVINYSGQFDMGEVPLGFRAAEAGETTLEFKNLETFGYDVTLIDKALNKRVDLKKMPVYPFTVAKSGAGAVEINDRFDLEMRYTGSGVTFTGTEQASPALQVTGGAGYIYVKSEIEPVTSVQVYDAIGRLVYDASHTGNYQVKIAVSSRQIYVVRAAAGQGSILEKVFVK